MIVYRIAKTMERAADLSGLGAFLFGGRWNSMGTDMLYTSENSSLAYLEVLAHLSEFENPPALYITQIEIANDSKIYEFPDKDYPVNWRKGESEENKSLGDGWMKSTRHLAIKVRSIINPTEYNILINPHFPDFANLVKIILITPLTIDRRLRR